MEKLGPTGKYSYIFSIAFLSCAVILYELFLTRMFSVVFSYHYSFAILSMVMFGFGLGGLVHYIRRHKWNGRVDKSISQFVITSVGAVALWAGIGLFTPVIPRSTAFLMYLLFSLIPFIAAGAAVSGLFHRRSSHIPAMYAGDLAGASVGAVTAFFIMNWTGPVIGVLFVGIIGFLALLCADFEEDSRILLKKKYLFSLAVIAVHGVVTIGLGGDLSISNDMSKDFVMVSAMDDETEVKERRWSSFGRTDLLAGSDRNESMSLFIDGAAGTVMYHANQLGNYNNSFYGFPGLLVLRNLGGLQKDSSLVIGAGAGRDVIAALMAGVNRVTAVEVNPDIIGLMEEYEDYNGGLYTRLNQVDFVTQEGRRFIRNSREKYDTILMTMPVTKSSRSIGGYALTESTLFTVEAFQDYFSHLTEEGALIITAHHEPEIQKLLSLALDAYSREGVSPEEALKRTILIGSPAMPVLVFARKSFDRNLADQLYAYQVEAGFPAERIYVPGRDLSHLPPESTAGRFFALEKGVMDPGEYVLTSPWRISPSFDDSPFFYQFDKKILKAFPPVLWIFMILFPLLMLLFVRRRKSWYSLPEDARSHIYIFIILGIGFMVIELSLFQKMMFLFKNPAAAASFLLFSLLMGAGLGSSFCRKGLSSKLGGLERSLATVAASLPVAFLLLDMIVSHPAVPPWLAVPVVITVGFVMGMPFPQALSRLNQLDADDAIPLFWSVNGAFSMVGAFLSMILGMTVGFRWSGFIGALLYGLAILFVRPAVKGADVLTKAA